MKEEKPLSLPTVSGQRNLLEVLAERIAIKKEKLK